MRDLLVYLLWPNPGNADYTSPKALALIAICALMVLGSFTVRYWRNRLQNPVTKRLSRSWASAAFWFGIIGLFFIVCRVEEIQFLAMRLWWLLWLAALLVYVVLQVRIFRARHYQVLPQERTNDPRRKYLPGNR